MRYRRLSYRYALVLTTGELRPLGEIWPADGRSAQLAQTRWRPAADVYEGPGGVTVVVDLAGVDLEDLDVLLYEDAVIVEGQRRLPILEHGGRYHAAEIRQGHFRLAVALPAPIDPERVAARYERGLPEMTFPRAEVNQHGH